MQESAQAQPQPRRQPPRCGRPAGYAFLTRLGADLASAVEPLSALAVLLADIVTLCRGEAGMLLADPNGGGGFHCVARLGCSGSEEAELCSGFAAACGREVTCYENGREGLDIPPQAEALFGRSLAGLVIVPVAGPDGQSGLYLIAYRPDAAVDAERASFLEAFAAVVGMALERAVLRSRLEEVHGLGRDLESAAELQRSLQPDSDPAHLPIWGINQPARKVSGDFYDFYHLDEDRFAFALGDVSGKGMNAALLMAKTVSLFRCLGKRIERPSELLEAINGELYETATRGMFVTMVAGHYCAASGHLTFANGGHQPPLLRRPDRSYETFPASAPPLGILPATRFADETLDLANGEFFVFTDGLTEYRYDNGEELGVDGLIQLVELHAGRPPAERLQALLDDLAQESGWQVRDDLTMLAIDDAWVRSGWAGDADGARSGDLEAAR